VLPPWWATVCVTMGMAFAVVGQTPPSAPVSSSGEPVFDQVRKVEFYALQSAAKLPPRKVASEQHIQWLAWSGQIELKPASNRCCSELTRENYRVLATGAGTFRERAPPV